MALAERSRGKVETGRRHKTGVAGGTAGHGTDTIGAWQGNDPTFSGTGSDQNGAGANMVCRSASWAQQRTAAAISSRNCTCVVPTTGTRASTGIMYAVRGLAVASAATSLIWQPATSTLYNR